MSSGKEYHQQYHDQQQQHGPLLPLPPGSGQMCPLYDQMPKPVKSDMCLINELVRGLNLRHEYRLVSESGPAHKKLFTVSLKLGDLESYEGSGPSIKKAQQAAASRALKETKLSHSLQSRKKKSTTTPTVELNVYAMKQGLQVSYVVNEPRILMPDGTFTGGGPYTDPCQRYNESAQRFNDGTTQISYSTTCCSCPASDCSSSQLSPTSQSTHSSSSWNGSNHQSPVTWNGDCNSSRGRGRSGHWSSRYSHPTRNLQPGQRYVSTTTDLYEAIVTVGNCQYYGTSGTPQGARHAAAQSALDFIRASSGSNYGSSCGGCDDASSQASTSSSMSSSVSSAIDSSQQKPVIVSLLKRAAELNLSVNFQVVQNLGPSHLPTFVTQCTAGRLMVQSQGHSKKESKKRAAIDMLALLDQIKMVPNRHIAPSPGQQILVASMTTPVMGPMIPNGHVQVLNGSMLQNGSQVIHSSSALIPNHGHIMTTSSPGTIIAHHHSHIHHGHHGIIHPHPMTSNHLQPINVPPHQPINVVHQPTYNHVMPGGSESTIGHAQ